MMENSLVEIAIKIGLAALLAGIVGAERESTGQWAGLRTHMLIAVGSTFLTDVSIKVGPMFAEGSQAWDPGRIAAQIVSGIGFLGAGTIIQSRGAVHGLTTAAGLWVASAIGIAVGAGLYAESVVVSIALFLILAAMRPVERRLFGKTHTMVLQLEPGKKASDLMGLFEEEEIEAEDFSVTHSGGEERSVRVRFRGGPDDAKRLIRRARDQGLVSSEDAGTSRPPFP